MISMFQAGSRLHVPTERTPRAAGKVKTAIDVPAGAEVRVPLKVGSARSQGDQESMFQVTIGPKRAKNGVPSWVNNSCPT